MNETPTKFRAAWSSFQAWAEDLLARIFQPRRDHVSRLIFWFGAAALFVYGIRVWGVFFSWGNIALDFADWAEVFGPRFAILQDAALRWQFPLHVADTTAMRGVTDRYLATPDSPISPQFLLLRFMELSTFQFVNTLLLYAAGFVGLLLFARKYRLSLFSFSLLFFLFFFNGHIIGHLSVGHMNWMGYFLQPFFLYLLFELAERQKVNWQWTLGLALTLLAILLQGHFHLFVWCIMLLGFLGLFQLRLLKTVLVAGVFSVLVSLPRLLPPVLVVNEVTQEPLGGFATWTDLLGSMVVFRDPDRAFAVIPSYSYPLDWWEINHFIGVFGAALLVVFGIIMPLRADRRKDGMAMLLLVPSLIFAALSIGRMFTDLLNLFPIPLPPFTGERVTARFLALPMLVVITLAVITIDGWVKTRKFAPWQFLLLLAAGGMMVYDLFQHLYGWRIRYLDGLVYLFPKVPFDPALHVVSNHPDPVYIGLLAGGGMISLVTLVFLVVQSLRERRPQPPEHLAE